MTTRLGRSALTFLSATLPPNATRVTLDDLFRTYGGAPWAHHLIQNSHVRANIICQEPGPKPRGHWHPTSDEWWVVLLGEMEWEIEEVGVYRVRSGDAICAPRGHCHKIRVLGDGPAVRLTVGASGRQHLEPDELTPAERRRAHGQLLSDPNGHIVPDTPAWLPPNLPHVYIEDIKAARGPAPWTHRLIINEQTRGSLAYELPKPISAGDWHPFDDEWWLVLEGETEWVVEGLGTMTARRNEFVCVPAGRLHKIHVVGDRPSLRLAVVTPNVVHLPPSAGGPARWRPSESLTQTR
jgi:mannose-6-phosphate isomerase-like protein (cupin superfamily)